jgi:hypothetical protein
MARRRRREPFDPYPILAALERERVTYIVTGALARVIHGADEITRGIDLTPSTRPENLRRVDLALGAINSHGADGGEPLLQTVDYEVEPVVELWSDYSELKIVPVPEGTRGYDDLRRAVTREPIGRGLRPSVASPGDLARMLSALGRERDIPNLIAMRRLIELERGLTIER